MSRLLAPRPRGLLPLLLVGVVLTSFVGYAQLGGTSGVRIPYAGYLEHDGVPIDSPTPITFRFTLWSAPTGGTACPAQYLAASPVRAGRFSVEIGPVQESCVVDRDVYLSLEVDQGGGFTSLGGRQRVHPAVGALTSGAGDFLVSNVLEVLSDTFLGGRLRVASGEDVGLNQNGGLIVGPPNGLNLALDGNELMARNNSGTAPLYLNNDGGSIYLGSIDSTVHVNGRLDASTLTAGTLTVSTITATTRACPTGWTAIAGGRLCIENTMRGDQMHSDNGSTGALVTCRNMGARVCTHADVQQACGSGFNVFANRDTTASFWLNDLVGDDAFMTVNSYTCAHANITAGPANAISGWANYRCCM